MKSKKVISLVLCFTLLFSIFSTNQAYAWKVKTHNYSANLILEEVMSTRGKVIIAPFGQFDVAPEFYTALKKYPQAYRAGSLGPDAYPDIYVGQTFLHPATNRTSGEWLRLMVEDALSLPENSDKRYEIIAFLLGFMTHYSGDLFGHTYINQIANGAYPDMVDLADPNKAEDALSIILKHISSEGIIDSKIPKKYGKGEYINIDAPNEFVLDSFVYDGAKDNGLSSKYNGIDKPKHFEYLVEVRQFAKKKADYYRQANNSQNIIDYGENTLICNYLDAWVEDIDKAINEWINVSERIAKGLITSGKESDLIIAVNELKQWLDSYGKYITPAPDVLIDALNLPGNVAKFFSEKLGIDVLQNLYDEFTAYFDKLIMDFMIYDVVGMTEEQVAEMKKAFAAPNLILGEEVIAKLTNDMKNFDTNAQATMQEFAPFYNTITMAKLVLIGPDGYKKLIKNSKSFNNTNYNYSTAVPKIDNLKVTIKTSPLTYYKSIAGVDLPNDDNAGTDDDIYFGVQFKDGSVVKQLLDKSGYNDFEAGDKDTYDVALGKKVNISDISRFIIEKKGTGLVGPDWKPKYFQVSTYNGHTKYKDINTINIDQYIKGSRTLTYDPNNIPVPTSSEEKIKLKVRIKTSGITKYKGLFGVKYPHADNAGTDDDIYIGIKFRDGTTVKKLCDKSGYNDFEAGDDDIYEFELDKNTKVNDIVQFFIEKRGKGLPGPDWKLSFFDVDIILGNEYTIHYNRNEFNDYIKGSTTKYFNASAKGNATEMIVAWQNQIEEIRNKNNEQNSLQDASYKTALNSGIIDFLGSLDESLQWQHKDFILWSDTRLRKDIFYKVFKDVEKYDDPNFDPYAFIEGYIEPEKPEEPKMEDKNLTDVANSLNYVNASNWAINEMKNAVINGLVKDYSIFEDCSANITRRDFAEITVNLYEALIKAEAQVAPENTFTDSKDIFVRKANKVGIVGGKGDGRFAPNDFLTRQEMSAMFKRVIDAVYKYKTKTYKETPGELSVEDIEEISSWAKKQVRFVYVNKIITGDGTNFNPKGTAPVQQAVAIINRVFVKYQDEFIAKTQNMSYDFKSSWPSMNIVDGSFSGNLAYDGSLYVTPSGEDDALMTINGSSFVNGTIETNITLYDAVGGEANDTGVVFRTSNAVPGANNYRGYFVGLSPNMNGQNGKVIFGYHDVGRWTELATYKTNIVGRNAYNLKIVANDNDFNIYLDNTKVISATDSKYADGEVGFRVLRIPTIFQNLEVK